MPNTRPESITIAPSQPEPTLLNGNGNGNNTGFPFRPAEVVTPTTSAESSMFSNGSQGHASASGSPFTSIDSRKNSLDGAAALYQGEGEGLERPDSTTPKASDETETRQAVMA